MFDKRELRRQHKVAFENQLAAWRSQHGGASSRDSPTSSPQSEAPSKAALSDRVRVCVRKRPLFEYERELEEFDVVSVRGGSEVVMHNCLTKADLKSLFISHMGFSFANAYGEAVCDDEIYESCAAPAVRHMQNGGVATMFMFGQTGSGKTHTMSGLLSRAAGQLFSSESAGGLEDDAGEPRRFLLEAFEIAGKSMRDLLGTSPGELRIMEDKEHKTRVLGSTTVEVDSAAALLQRVRDAQSRRATRATQANDTSSRSHAVYRIWPLQSSTSSSSSSSSSATLTLVDCAGTERREDSTHHDAKSRKDAAEINATLFALKECFRVLRAPKNGQQPPFRESLLTRVLGDSFACESARVVAIGTVSPSAADTEHSIATLRALQGLQGTQATFETREDVAARPTRVADPHPRCWTEEEVRRWLDDVAGPRSLGSELSKGTDGRVLVRWPAQRFAALCGEEALGAVLYQDLRQRIRAASGGA
eukprot:TRINITY_DN12694_c0_g2_i1.p1 TRINITY_DN12694_c0_g2~~TRINITY_DN12694_c0_g2_i1.p1  ORF type:complete len:477 (+),score=114.60 TRINITY_DN12694_c0_g2_i1:212-1642(+)